MHPLIRSLAVLAAGVLALSTPADAQDMRPFTDIRGTVMIPVDPQRIVSLQDVGLTVPLLELGVVPVGSQGRVASDGSHYIRSARALTGLDYDNAGIAFVGAGQEFDLETIAALRPDLIINNTDTAYEQLSAIAPTVIPERNPPDRLEQLRQIADAAGALDHYEDSLERFNAQIAELKRLIPNASEITVSLFQAGDGSISAWSHSRRGALGYVLAAVGFKLPAIVAEAGTDSVNVSAEQLPALDGDFIIDTYRNDLGSSPAEERAALEAILPGWCSFLQACVNRQYFVLPRDEALAISFRAFDLMIMAIQTNIAGREYVPFGE